MPSPFPGMDPYLERHWEDVHPRLIGYIADALAPQLADDLAARIEERVYIDSGDYAVPIRRPDVSVVEDPTPWIANRPKTAGVALAEPVILKLNRDPIREGSVHIMDMNGDKVVTAIEVLSPWNKASRAGRKAYLEKRAQVLLSDTNLIEIDLVRAGDWLTLLSSYHVPRPYHTTYRANVMRATKRDEAALYRITLQQTLPAIPIPLREAERDATLELQPLLDKVYRNSRYDRINYAVPCEPALEGEDAAWADDLLRAAKKR